MRSDERPRPGRSREPRLRGRPRLSIDVGGPKRSLAASAGWCLVLASHRASWTSHPLIRSEVIRGSPARARSAPQHRAEAADASRRSVPAGRHPRLRRRLGSRSGPGAGPGARLPSEAAGRPEPDRGAVRKGSKRPVGAGRTRSSPRWSSLCGRGCRRASPFWVGVLGRPLRGGA